MRFYEFKIKEENLEGDALYAKLIKQQFPMGAGYELHAGMTHEMWYRELKLANRWLATAVRAGDIKPPVSIGNDFTIRDKHGQDIGIPGQWDPSMKPKAAKPVNESKLFEADARIQHAEDFVIFDGSAGAVRVVQSLKNLEQGGHTDVTIKWDGSPAIIFGRNADGEFILTDKSGFGAKGYDGRAKSAKALQQMLMARPGANNPDPDKAANYKVFVGNMADIYDEYEKAVPKYFVGYFKGDLLYYNTPPVEDNKFVFTPNIVTYRVDTNSPIGQRIAQSKTGVVIHRLVDEEGNEKPLPPGIADIFEGNEVFVVPPVTVERAPQVEDDNIKELRTIINKDATAIDKFLNTETLTGLKLKGLPQIFYTYTNSKVDTGLENLGKDFTSWLAASKVSKPMQQRIVDYIAQNQQGFDAMWEVMNKIREVKNNIIKQLDSHDADVKANIGDIEGGEGYVLAHPEGDIKLVNRAGFTAANRAVQR